MKRIIAIIITFSFSFSGTVYFAIDTGPKWEVAGVDLTDIVNLEGGASIGYNHPVYQDGRLMFDIGASYNIMPMKATLDTEGELGFMNIYALPKYAMSQNTALWMALGVTVPTHDADDADTGTIVGVGMSYKMNQTWSVGLGYVINTLEEEGIEFDFTDVKFYIGHTM